MQDSLRIYNIKNDTMVDDLTSTTGSPSVDYRHHKSSCPASNETVFSTLYDSQTIDDTTLVWRVDIIRFPVSRPVEEYRIIDISSTTPDVGGWLGLAWHILFWADPCPASICPSHNPLDWKVHASFSKASLLRIFEASTSVSKADSDQLNPTERLWKVSRRADRD